MNIAQVTSRGDIVSPGSVSMQHCRRPCSSCHSLRCRGYHSQSSHFGSSEESRPWFAKSKETCSQAPCSFCTLCS